MKHRTRLLRVVRQKRTMKAAFGYKIHLTLLCIWCSLLSHAQDPKKSTNMNLPTSPEISTTLMETTFFISGPSAKVGEENQVRFGTTFIMARQSEQDGPIATFVLVTAKHVFEDIKGDTATILLRKRDANGDPVAFPFALKIRELGKPLYTAHPTADVAAMDVSVPLDSIIFQLGPAITSINWLASDGFVKDINLHPGDELLCLGYPMGLRYNAGQYPMLRSGKIASYPLTPLKKASPILYDFRVYPGNSGGPVYFAYSDRVAKGSLQFGTTYQKIFGIVTQQAGLIGNVDPSIGVIVPSIYIKETIDSLSGFESKVVEEFP